MLDLQAQGRFMVNSWERGCRSMSESEEDGDPLARLELALDRIARRATLLGGPANSADPASSVDIIADRLTALIGQIRGALDNGAPAIEE